MQHTDSGWIDPVTENQSQNDRTLVNPWRRASSGENPYRRTVFRVARVPREATSRKAVVQLVSQTRKLVNASPESHVVGGHVVTSADVNRAEQLLLASHERIVEELLCHAAERPPLDKIKRVAEQAAAAMSSLVESHENDDPCPVTGIEVLHAWARAIVERFLEESPSPHPSFGATELELIPPFGNSEG